MAKPRKPASDSSSVTSSARKRSASADTEIAELSFEAALGRLEGIVDRLEEGDLELEGALVAFEEGVSLSRCCAEQLDRAERRIQVLLRDGESWKTRPFENDEIADEESE